MTAITPPPARRRQPKIIRVAKTRPRLFISMGVGLLGVAAFALLVDRPFVWALLVGWDICGALYLTIALQLMNTSEVNHMRRRARLQDAGQRTILVLTALAALASLAAIFDLLSTSHGHTRGMTEIILATATILISWAFTHTMF